MGREIESRQGIGWKFFTEKRLAYYSTKECPRLPFSWHNIQGCQMDYFHTISSKLWYILEGLGMKNVGIFHGQLVYIFDGQLVLFITTIG
jgi:hypothetical protein